MLESTEPFSRKSKSGRPFRWTIGLLAPDAQVKMRQQSMTQREKRRRTPALLEEVAFVLLFFTGCRRLLEEF